MPFKEPEQERWAGNENRGPKAQNTKQQQKGRRSRRQGPTSQAKTREPGGGVEKKGYRFNEDWWRVLEATLKTPGPVASAD